MNDSTEETTTMPEEINDALELNVTPRGFGVIEFRDSNGHECSVQCSSAWRHNDFNPEVNDNDSPGATMLWLGIDNASPQIMRSDARKIGMPDSQGNGWMPYPLPEGVHCTTRMHLTRANAAAIGDMLSSWARSGELQMPTVGRLERFVPGYHDTPTPAPAPSVPVERVEALIEEFEGLRAKAKECALSAPSATSEALYHGRSEGFAVAITALEKLIKEAR